MIQSLSVAVIAGCVLLAMVGIASPASYWVIVVGFAAYCGSGLFVMARGIKKREFEAPTSEPAQINQPR